MRLFQHLQDERSHADGDDRLPELDQDANNPGRPMPLMFAADEDKGGTRVVFIRNLFAFVPVRTALRSLITMFVSNGKMTDAPPIGGSLPGVPRELSTEIVRLWFPRATATARPLYVAPLRLLFDVPWFVTWVMKAANHVRRLLLDIHGLV